MMRSTLALLLGVILLAAAPHALAQDTRRPIRAAFVLLETVDDQGWTLAHHAGIQQLQRDLGQEVETAVAENVSPDQAEAVLRSFAAQGYDVIFGTTFDYMDAMLAVARDYPDTIFMHCSGYAASPNLGTYFVRIYQAEYLAGYMAGLMGFHNVGTVATVPIPEVVRGINAFTLGLTRGLTESGADFDPKAVNTVVWLGSWRDPVQETALAQALAAEGRDLIRQMADTPDSSLAACAAGVPAVGYGVDAAFFGADCVLASTIFNWGPIYERTVSRIARGQWRSEQYWGGFEDHGVILSPFGSAVPKDVRDKVQAALERLEAGEDTIFVGPLVNQAGEVVVPEGQKASDQLLLEDMTWFVRGVQGAVPR